MSGGDAGAPSEDASSDQTAAALPPLPKRAVRLHLNTTPKKGPTPNATWDLLAYESCLTCAEGGQIDKHATAIRMHVPANVWGGLDVHTQKRYLSKRKLTTAISDVEVTSFINCGGIVSAVEIVGPFSFDDSGDYSVFTVASCSCLVDPDEGPLDYLVFHEMVVKRVSDEGSGGSAHCVVDLHKPRLAKVSPLTGRSCIGVQWINGGNFPTVNEKTDGDRLFLALLMKDGSIELCKFDLGCSVTYNEVMSDEIEIPYDPPIVLWRYDAKSHIPNQYINAIDVSYETAPRDPYALQSSVTYPTEAPVEDPESASAPQCNSVIVAGGTIDGYLYIWRFDWDVMCRTAGAKDDFSPFFSQMIPIFVDPQDDEPSHRIVSLHFLPTPQSYLLAIALYMGTVVTWDIRNGTLEGEINAYYTVNRPVTIARWTENKQFLIIGGPSVMCVEWASKVGMTALSYDRVSRVACSGSCDNICWSVDSSANFVYLVYDDGLFVQAPVVALTKRNVQDVVTSYLWEPFVKEDEPVASVADVDTQDPMAAAQELAELQFKMDMTPIRTHGVCVTRNGSRFRGARKGKVESDRVIRNKVYSHHCVKARSVLFSEFRLSFMAYGGHTGLLHVIIKHS